MLNVGSLFAGIGGFDLGFERAGGFRTAWFCERDEFCQRVLVKHWPDVPCYPDITELRAADVEPVDVLCGGFPCQDLSVAGKGAGIDGARSGLWSEYARLVGELRPSYVVVENVPALRSRGLHRVLQDLAALRYDAEWDCIPASAVGAPHRRDRIWLVAYPQRVELREQSGRRGRKDREGTSLVAVDGQARPLADAYGQRRQRRPTCDGETRSGGTAERPAISGPDVADTRGEGLERRRDEGPAPDGAGAHGNWASEPDVGRVAHGVPARVDRLRALGNALVPQIAEWIGGRILEHEQGAERAAA